MSDISGGTSGGAASFDGKVSLLPYTKERFIQECAIRLYSNMNFDSYGAFSVQDCVRNAVNRAKALAQQLEFSDVKFTKN